MTLKWRGSCLEGGRELKRKERSDMEKDGVEALLRMLSEKLMKLRKAENRRQKQRQIKKNYDANIFTHK